MAAAPSLLAWFSGDGGGCRSGLLAAADAIAGIRPLLHVANVVAVGGEEEVSRLER